MPRWIQVRIKARPFATETATRCDGGDGRELMWWRLEYQIKITSETDRPIQAWEFPNRDGLSYLF